MEPVTPDTLMTFLARAWANAATGKPASTCWAAARCACWAARVRRLTWITQPMCRRRRLKRSSEAMTQLADEFHLDLEEVPLAEFVPLPPLAHERHRLIGRFGLLEVYLFDPYSIALSKIARGFESDLEDVLFLLRTGAIEFAALEQHFRAILPRVAKADIDSKDFQACFLEIRQRYSQT